MADKTRSKRRAKDAERLERLTKGLYESLDQIPSFTGKARFMDKVGKVKAIAHNLAWELKRDAEEDRGA